MTANHETLKTLAHKMMLTVAQTIALPATITAAANGQGMTEADLVSVLMDNGPAREYIANICRRVA